MELERNLPKMSLKHSHCFACRQLRVSCGKLARFADGAAVAQAILFNSFCYIFIHTMCTIFSLGLSHVFNSFTG